MRAAGRLALLLALAPAPLSAQAWYTIGGGAGGNRVSCADCEKIERFWGGSGYLRAGGTVGRNVSVGGEFAFWQASIDGSDAYLRAIEGVVLWHPKPPGDSSDRRGSAWDGSGTSTRSTARPSAPRRPGSASWWGWATTCGWGSGSS